MNDFFARIVEKGHGTQKVTIEQIRFLAPGFVVVDGSWTVTGARDAEGKELPPIHGHGTEVVQKRNGQWKFVATREMLTRE